MVEALSFYTLPKQISILWLLVLPFFCRGEFAFLHLHERRQEQWTVIAVHHNLDRAFG